MLHRAPHTVSMHKAVLSWSTALVLCVGLLWPVPLSFAASETEADAALQKTKTATVAEPAPAVEAADQPATSQPSDDANNVVVEAPSAEAETPLVDPAPAPSEPVAPPSTEPTVSEYENAWPIGLDEPMAVVAELWDDGTFVVDGTGETVAFENADEVPWLAADMAANIKRVVFANAIESTSLAHWFERCVNLEEIANLPATTKDYTRLFFECPKLVELPDDFAFADDAETDELFGFEQLPANTVETIYRGADANVLAYDWAKCGRVLINPDAPVVDADSDLDADRDTEIPDSSDEVAQDPIDDDKDAAIPQDDPATEVPNDERVNPDVEASENDSQASTNSVAPEEAPASTTASASEEDPADVQVNITIPSSVTMSLGAEGTNAAMIPVMVANRSERDVAIVGARLKRADMDLPGGSWSFTTESGHTTFVSDARFTPLGLEVPFDMPVVLRAGGDAMTLVWHSEFSDYGMKTLLNAVLNAGDAGFTYGSMIWIVSAV